MSSIPWYVGLSLLGVTWLAGGLVGRRNAFNHYRQTLKEMLESAETPEEKSGYKRALNKTDDELMQTILNQN